jgi:ferric-dicitrate binding protein FerR (iron transport regulator)
MRRLTCQRVEESLFDFQDGALDEDERAAIAVHLAICDACRDAADLCAGLKVAAGKAPLPASAARERLGAPGDAFRSPSRWAARAFAAAACVVLASGGLWLAVHASGTTPRPPAPPPAGTAVDEPSAAPVAEITDGSGRRAFDVGPGTALRLAEGVSASIAASRTDEVRFSLRSGRAIAEVGAVAPYFRFVVEAPRARIEARGTVFSVDVPPSGDPGVRVAEGCVEITFDDGRAPVLLNAGEELRSGDLSPRVAAAADLARDLAAALELDTADGALAASVTAPGDLAFPTRAEAVQEAEDVVAAIARAKDRIASAPRGSEAERLLELAQAYRRAALFEDAVRVYDRLVAGRAGSEIGESALVSLAQLEAHILGRTAAARAHYEAYLAEAPDGPLASAARLGLAELPRE